MTSETNLRSLLNSQREWEAKNENLLGGLEEAKQRLGDSLLCVERTIKEIKCSAPMADYSIFEAEHLINGGTVVMLELQTDNSNLFHDYAEVLYVESASITVQIAFLLCGTDWKVCEKRELHTSDEEIARQLRDEEHLLNAIDKTIFESKYYVGHSPDKVDVEQNYAGSCIWHIEEFEFSIWYIRMNTD